MYIVQISYKGQNYIILKTNTIYIIIIRYIYIYNKSMCNKLRVKRCGYK